MRDVFIFPVPRCVCSPRACASVGAKTYYFIYVFAGHNQNYLCLLYMEISAFVPLPAARVFLPKLLLFDDWLNIIFVIKNSSRTFSSQWECFAQFTRSEIFLGGGESFFFNLVIIYSWDRFWNDASVNDVGALEMYLGPF